MSTTLCQHSFIFALSVFSMKKTYVCGSLCSYFSFFIVLLASNDFICVIAAFLWFIFRKLVLFFLQFLPILLSIISHAGSTNSYLPLFQ